VALVGIGNVMAIGARSSKQKIVTKCSTETELRFATDMTGDFIDLKEFGEEIGYSVESATVYQDNTFTIHVLANTGV